MNFIPQTNEELTLLNLVENNEYTIEYLNRDYFNGVENIERTKGKLIFDENNNYIFLIKDDYGMDKFIKDIRLIN